VGQGSFLIGGGALGARGFSLLELMVVLALALGLAALAVPSYQGLLQRWALSTEAQALVEDLRHARAQALARGQPVSVCPSVDGQVCATHADWGQGWLIFLDADGNRVLAGEDRVLRQHRVAASIESITSNSGASRAGLTYQPNGQARAAGQGLSLRGAAAGSRLVCISMQGRAVVRPEGQTQCA
jgi:type IV fimbrial biogenesis protein FimT